jgi:hypothetical protein
MSTGDGASVKRHTCPDETAQIVNGRWVCQCPGGPYSAPLLAPPRYGCGHCGKPITTGCYCSEECTNADD